MWRAIGRALTPDERDVLALAVPGDSTCAEIASVMNIDRASVHRVLRGALAGAGTALGLSA
jgi:DNA-directed RNA polymerase specialized sigma24 family protein